MAAIYAVANQKGGVGKTVSAINIAANFALRGEKTLLLDLDSQGHSGIGLGLEVQSLLHTSYELLTKGSTKIQDCIIPAPFEQLCGCLDMVASNLKLAVAEREIERTFALPNLVLSKKLKPVLNHYQRVVLDCPPALSMLTINAFIAADTIIVPISAGYFSLHGLRMIAATLSDINEEIGLSYQLRCMLTRFRPRELVSRDIRQHALKLFGEFYYTSVIRESVDVEKSVGAQTPLAIYKPSCSAARDYADLVQEILAS